MSTFNCNDKHVGRDYLDDALSTLRWATADLLEVHVQLRDIETKVKTALHALERYVAEQRPAPPAASTASPDQTQSPASAQTR